jgi:hypothetical protein
MVFKMDLVKSLNGKKQKIFEIVVCLYQLCRIYTENPKYNGKEYDD